MLANVCGVLRCCIMPTMADCFVYTLVQLLTPDNLRARVTSLTHYNIGFVVLSSLAIGWLIDLTNLTVGITVVGAVGLVLALCAWFTLTVIHDLE